MLGVAQVLELVVQGLLAGGEVVGLRLERGGGERRLLHLGVEAEQPDDAAEQHQADQGHERHPRRPDPAPRDDGEPGPVDGGLGEPREALAELEGWGAHAAAPVGGLDAFDGAQPDRGGARVGWRSRRRRPARRRG